MLKSRNLKVKNVLIDLLSNNDKEMEGTSSNDCITGDETKDGTEVEGYI